MPAFYELLTVPGNEASILLEGLPLGSVSVPHCPPPFKATWAGKPDTLKPRPDLQTMFMILSVRRAPVRT